MLDLIRKRHSGYGQLWPLRPACSRNRPGSYMPVPPSRIRFGSFFFFQGRHGSHCTKWTRIWSGWSGQGLATHIWSRSKLVCRIIGPGFWQDATVPLPVSYFQTRFRSSTDVPDNTVQNQPGSGLVLTDCVRFWPNGSGPEASRCARVVRPASDQFFPADPDRMRIVSGMFTGELICTRKTSHKHNDKDLP